MGALWQRRVRHRRGVAARTDLDLSAITSAVAHPARVRILIALADSAEPRSPVGLADALGQSIGMTAHHVRVLRDTGVIVAAGTTPRRGTIEHFYVLAPDDRLHVLLAALERFA